MNQAGAVSTAPVLDKEKPRRKRRYKAGTQGNLPRPLSSVSFAPLRIEADVSSTDLIAAFDTLSPGTLFFTANPSRSTAPARRVVRDVVREYHPAYVVPLLQVSRGDNGTSLEGCLRRLEDVYAFSNAQAQISSEEKVDKLLASLIHFGTRRVLTRKRKVGRHSEWLAPAAQAQPSAPCTNTNPVPASTT
jgi:hypothetical protein